MDVHISKHLTISRSDCFRKGCEDCKLPKKKPYLHRLLVIFQSNFIETGYHFSMKIVNEFSFSTFLFSLF